MHKQILITFLIVSLVGVTAIANHIPIKDKYWNQIDINDKFNMVIRDYSGDATLTIAGFYSRPANNILWDDVNIERVLKKWWGDRKVLTLFISPYGNQYFWPTEFVFTQGSSQYNISYTDIAKISESFTSGELKGETVTNGFLAIPSGIDTNSPYTIWYDDTKVTM